MEKEDSNSDMGSTTTFDGASTTMMSLNRLRSSSDEQMKSNSKSKRYRGKSGSSKGFFSSNSEGGSKENEIYDDVGNRLDSDNIKPLSARRSRTNIQNIFSRLTYTRKEKTVNHSS